MKIISLHIENFGRLSNYDLVFNDGLNVINQPNGWGKTTLATFIKAMFYGMDKKGNNAAYKAERSKFLPWQGGVYGGSLIFEVKGKTYHVLRTFAPTPEGDRFELVDLATQKLCHDYSDKLGEEIFGVGRQTFTLSTYFGQNDLGGDANDEVRSHLSGAAEFSGDMERASIALKKIKEKSAKIKTLMPKVYEINSAQDELDKLKINLSRLEEQKSQLKNNLASLPKEEPQSNEEFKIVDNADVITSKLQTISEQIKENEACKNQISQQKKQVKKRFFSLVTFCVLAIIATIILAIFEIKVGAIFAGAIAGASVILSIALIGFIKNYKTEIYQQATSLGEQLLLQQQKLQKQLSEFAKSSSARIEQVKIEGESQKQRAVIIRDLEYNAREIELLLGQIDDMEAKVETLISQKSIMQSKLMLLENVQKFILQAQQNLSQRYVEPMQQKFSAILKKLSFQPNIRLNSDLQVTLFSPSGVKEEDYLSRGCQDAALICKRFALIESIFTKDKPFIILDDPFVNLDDTSLKAAIELTKAFAQNFQILYFTCHSSREK